MKRPEFLRKILKSKRLKTAFAYVLYQYSRLVFYSCQWRMEFPDANPYNSKNPKIFVLWHSQLFLTPLFRPEGEKTDSLVSFNNDGLIAARTMEFFGVGVISGSRRKGGTAAAFKAISAIEAGHNLAVTPDGPKGPAEIASPGVIVIASKTGAPIIPVSYSAHVRRRLASWDRFILPFPFSRAAFVCGDAIHVPAGIDEKETERYRLMVENALNEITARAERLVHTI